MSTDENNDSQLDIDSVLKRLLADPGKLVQLHEEEMNILCDKSQDIFLKQPMLLELNAPIKICGNFN